MFHCSAPVFPLSRYIYTHVHPRTRVKFCWFELHLYDEEIRVGANGFIACKTLEKALGAVGSNSRDQRGSPLNFKPF